MGGLDSSTDERGYGDEAEAMDRDSSWLGMFDTAGWSFLLYVSEWF